MFLVKHDSDGVVIYTVLFHRELINIGHASGEKSVVKIVVLVAVDADGLFRCNFENLFFIDQGDDFFILVGRKFHHHFAAFIESTGTRRGIGDDTGIRSVKFVIIQLLDRNFDLFALAVDPFFQQQKFFFCFVQNILRDTGTDLFPGVYKDNSLWYYK